MGLACAVVFVAGVMAAIIEAPREASAIEDVRAIGGEDRAGGTTAPGGREGALPGVADDLPSAPLSPIPAGIDSRRSASVVDVQARTWPSRVTADVPWAATVQGGGDRLVVTAPGVVVDGLRLASLSAEPSNQFDDDSTEAFLLPDGSQWFPQGAFALDGEGDLPFGEDPFLGFSAPPLSSTPAETTVSEVSFADLLAAARGPVAATGTFVGPDGASTSRLDLPAGARLASVCPPGDRAVTCPAAGSVPSLWLELDLVEGTEVRVSGDGEVMVGGMASATALGGSWEGQVIALDARQLNVSAQYRDGGWAVAGSGATARQLWIDAWPVVDTVLSATSTTNVPGLLRSIYDRNELRIQWDNIGFASSQIFEAEGTGPGASQVGFGLVRSRGHDTGLGVERGVGTVNLADGGAIETELPPGGRVDRGLRFERGSAATITLRGNFPDVVVPLAIDEASRE